MTREMSTLEARRQLSFLKSFDRKFHVLDRELQRLNRARNARNAASVGWPTDGLERAVKSLIGAGAVYGLGEISTWAREFLDKLGDIRSRKTPPTQTEMSWLADQIRALEKMQSEAVEQAEDVVANKAVSEHKTSVAESDARNKAGDKVSAHKAESKSEAQGDDAENSMTGSESAEVVDAKQEDTWGSALTSAQDVKADVSTGKPKKKKAASGEAETDAQPAGKAELGSDSEKPKVAKTTRKRKKTTTNSGEEKKSSDEIQLFVKSKASSAKPPQIIMTGVTASDGEEIKETAPLGLRALSRPSNPSALFSEDAPHIKASERESSRDTSESIMELSDDELEPQSDTMPVDIIDITEMSDDGDISDLSNAPLLPPVPVNSMGWRRFKWPAITAMLLLLLGVSFYFNISGGMVGASDDGSSNDDSSKAVPSGIAGKEMKAAVTVAEGKRSAESDGDTGGVGSESGKDTSVDTASAGEQDEADSPQKKIGRKARKKTAVRKRSAAKKTAAVKRRSGADNVVETKETKKSADDENTGRLRISRPSDASGVIRIFVDGEKRGKAPKILSLPVGLHEVRFEMDGKSSLKMVSIRKGSTKDITPKFK